MQLSLGDHLYITIWSKPRFQTAGVPKDLLKGKGSITSKTLPDLSKKCTGVLIEFLKSICLEVWWFCNSNIIAEIEMPIQ